MAGETDVSPGEEDSKKEQKMKKNKRKDEDHDSEGTTAGRRLSGVAWRFRSVLSLSDGSEGGRVHRTVLERWRESLQSCTSLSQVRLP